MGHWKEVKIATLPALQKWSHLQESIVGIIHQLTYHDTPTNMRATELCRDVANSETGGDLHGTVWFSNSTPTGDTRALHAVALMTCFDIALIPDSACLCCNNEAHGGSSSGRSWWRSGTVQPTFSTIQIQFTNVILPQSKVLLPIYTSLHICNIKFN